jgi:hypothetical protein
MAIYRLYRTSWDELLSAGTSDTYMPCRCEGDWQAQDEFEDLFQDFDYHSGLQACDLEFCGNSSLGMWVNVLYRMKLISDNGIPFCFSQWLSIGWGVLSP